MSRVARLYARTSVAYLVVSSLAGVYLVVDPNHPIQFRSAHSHLLLVGWVSLGLAAALLARTDAVTGIAIAGYGLTNAGLIAMTGAWLADGVIIAGWTRWALAGSGALEFGGLVLVAAAVWLAVGPEKGSAPAPAADDGEQSA